MTELFENLEVVAAILGVAASVVGLFVSVWSARKTRKEFYNAFLEHRRIKRDADHVD